MMNPQMRTQFATTKEFTAAGTVRVGMQIKLAATDSVSTNPEFPDAIECADNTVQGIGIVKGNAGDSYSSGETFTAWLLSSTILHVKVGTGGATRGSCASQAAAADGLTNLPAFGTGSVVHSPGVFFNTGVAGDHVAMMSLPAMTSKA